MTNLANASRLYEPLELPGGQTIPNRIAKAAMEENMADDSHLPGEALLRLYRQWSRGLDRLYPGVGDFARGQF